MALKFSKWMEGQGPESDIVLSSRVRIARNLAGMPFPGHAGAEATQEILRRAQAAVQGLGPGWGLRWRRLADLSPIERQVLVEKHLISPQLLEEPLAIRAVALDDIESISIMVNEEDHLRIQVLLPGLQLEQAWEVASRLDDALEAQVDFAFDPGWGYLTACPTNVGTALRASTMLHLPGLVLTRQIGQIFTTLAQVGVVVRGLYGEGSEAAGNVFQVSNQVSLGLSEEEFIHNLTVVTQNLIGRERQARRELASHGGLLLEDRVGRAYGVLANARLISSEEALRLLSDAKLGADLGLIPRPERVSFVELMVMSQPGFIQWQSERELNHLERDAMRARLLRQHLGPGVMPPSQGPVGFGAGGG